MTKAHLLFLIFTMIAFGVRGDDPNSPSGKAVPIPIVNASFEVPAKTAGSSTAEPPADWISSDTAEFVGFTGYVRDTDQYATAPDGNQYLEITAMNPANAVGFSYSQVTKFVAEPGDTFILHVDTATMNGSKLAGNFALTLNGSPVAFNPGDGTAVSSTTPGTVFYDQAVTYTVTDPALAESAVGVSLMTPYGSQDLYDNVRLEVIKGPSTASRILVVTSVNNKDRKGFRVFSCGHSYHFLNYNLPILLREVARSGGYPDHEIVGQSVIYGSKVIQHWDVKDEDNKAKASLLAGSVDVLTLTMLYLPDEGIEKFAQLGLEHNPNIRVTLQENWLPFDANNPHHFDPPAEPRPSTVNHNAATVEGLSAIHKPYWDEVDSLVTSINQKLGKPVVFVVPVGQAVLALRGKVIAGQAPGVKTQEDLFCDMLGHPTAPIQALTAYCQYAVIYKKNPSGLPVPTVLTLSKIPPENLVALNNLLQQLAWEAVTHHPLSGVVP